MLSGPALALSAGQTWLQADVHARQPSNREQTGPDALADPAAWITVVCDLGPDQRLSGKPRPCIMHGITTEGLPLARRAAALRARA